MPGLHEIQDRFTANLFDAESSDILADVKAAAFEPALRLQIYRNNVFTGFTEARRSLKLSIAICNSSAARSSALLGS